MGFVVAGLVVGFIVGMTGVGGGSLMLGMKAVMNDIEV